MKKSLHFALSLCVFAACDSKSITKQLEQGQGSTFIRSTRQILSVHSGLMSVEAA